MALSFLPSQQSYSISIKMIPTNWIIHVKSGNHFKSSSKYNIWGTNTITSTNGKCLLKRGKTGDLLWFVTERSEGKLLAVATLTMFKKRELGPLINFTRSNEELGWTKEEGQWDTEIHYEKLFDLSDKELFTHIKGAAPIRR